MSWLLDKILELFWYLLYLIDIFICWLLQAFYEIFNVFAGVDKVKIGTSENYLINIFFNNSTINIIFYGMLLIGFVMLFGFTIAAVIRKSFDLGDRIQQPMSEILRKAFNSFIFMICMNFIMSGTIYATNTLMTSITYLFNNADAIKTTIENTIEFTEEDYKTMAEIFDTIGTYAINPSSTSRYNVNSCFNSIRGQLQKLSARQPNFYRFTYLENNQDGDSTQSWQSVLAQIARSHDLATDQPLDEYNNSLSAAIDNAMKFVTVNKDNMTVLEGKYEISGSVKAKASSRLDVMMFLTATTEAANNTNYNGKNASFYDAVRGSYLTDNGRSIYEISQVEEDFSIALPEFKHFLLIICGAIMLAQFFEMSINAVARLFNMLLLYIVAPPFIAIAPFDDGSRFRQWCTAFIIQTFSVFGSVISIRLFLVIIPIVMQSDLVIFDNGVMNMLAKLGLIIAAGYTAHKASGLVGGIVGENAAQQAIYSGDVASSMENGMPGRLAGMAAGGAGDILSGTIGGAFKGSKGLLKSGMNQLKSWKQDYTQSKLRGNLDRSINGDPKRPGGPLDSVTRGEAAKDFLRMNPEEAKKSYGLSDAGYQNMRQNAEGVYGRYKQGLQQNLQQSLAGAFGQQEARRFLDMDKDQAKEQFGFSDSQYDAMRQRAENGLNFGQQRNDFLNKVRGDNGKETAENFLSKSPEEAMKSLGLDREQYDNLKSQLQNKFGGGGGSNPPADNNAGNVNAAGGNNANPVSGNNGVPANNTGAANAGAAGNNAAGNVASKVPPRVSSGRRSTIANPQGIRNNPFSSNGQSGSNSGQGARQRLVNHARNNNAAGSQSSAGQQPGTNPVQSAPAGNNSGAAGNNLSNPSVNGAASSNIVNHGMNSANVPPSSNPRTEEPISILGDIGGYGGAGSSFAQSSARSGYIYPSAMGGGYVQQSPDPGSSPSSQPVNYQNSIQDNADPGISIPGNGGGYGAGNYTQPSVQSGRNVYPSVMGGGYVQQSPDPGSSPSSQPVNYQNNIHDNADPGISIPGNGGGYGAGNYTQPSVQSGRNINPSTMGGRYAQQAPAQNNYVPPQTQLVNRQNNADADITILGNVGGYQGTAYTQQSVQSANPQPVPPVISSQPVNNSGAQSSGSQNPQPSVHSGPTNLRVQNSNTRNRSRSTVQKRRSQ